MAMEGADRCGIAAAAAATAASAAAVTGPQESVPLLVRLLAGNPVTAALVFGCLTSGDTGPLRRLHAAVAGAVARIPYADLDTRVRDVVAWRAALPAAVGLWVDGVPRDGQLLAAALAGLHTFDARLAYGINNATLAILPPSLAVLNVSRGDFTPDASFSHLVSLTSLDCSWTAAVSGGLAGLPPSLRELSIDNCSLPPCWCR